MKLETEPCPAIDLNGTPLTLELLAERWPAFCQALGLPDSPLPKILTHGDPNMEAIQPSTALPTPEPLRAFRRELLELQRRPMRRTNHRRALAKVQAAWKTGAEPSEVLHYGRLLGLRDRQIRRDIGGKDLHGKLSHPVPGRASPNRRAARCPEMLYILAMVQKAIEAGWDPNVPGSPNPLTDDEIRSIIAARRRVYIARYDRRHPKLSRNPEEAERMIRVATVGRKFKNRRRFERANATAKGLGRELPVLPPLYADPADLAPVAPAPEPLPDLGPILDEIRAGAARVFADAPPKKGGQWQLTLECGHTLTRPMKRRNGQLDPAPKWAYCDECEGRPKRNATTTGATT